MAQFALGVLAGIILTFLFAGVVVKSEEQKAGIGKVKDAEEARTVLEIIGMVKVLREKNYPYSLIRQQFKFLVQDLLK